MAFVNTGFLLLCVLCFLANNANAAMNEEQAKAALHIAGDVCSKEVPLTADEKKLALSHTIFNADAPPPNNNIKCFVRCFYNIIGLIGDDNTLSADDFGNIMKNVIKDKMDPKDLLGKCPMEKGDDACDSAYKWAKCLTEQLRSIGVTGF